MKEELERIVGRQAMMESSVWRAALAEGEEKGLEKGREKGREEGRAEGRRAGLAEGELGEDRLLCVEMLRQYHPAVLEALRSRVEACSDHARLRAWILDGPRMSDDEMTRAVS